MLTKISPCIAIIDSGMGGISVLKRIIEKYHTGNYIYFADNLNMPYGNKKKDFIKARINNLIRMFFETYKVDIVILACNTASSVISKNQYSSVLTIDFDENSTYLTTKLTKKNLPSLDVIADNTLASDIEKNIFNRDKLSVIIKRHVEKNQLNELSELVLGCTHYELVSDLFQQCCPDTIIKNNTESIMNKLKYEPCNDELNIKIILSKSSLDYEEKLLKLLGV